MGLHCSQTPRKWTADSDQDSKTFVAAVSQLTGYACSLVYCCHDLIAFMCSANSREVMLNGITRCGTT
jgi:hypothetical protein